MSDPIPLMFVDPAEVDPTYRVCLWAAPGQGKTVAATSAPGPILVLSADRPSAYRFARKHHKGKQIDEVRYVDRSTLVGIYRLLADNPGKYRTVIVDPFSNVYDQLATAAPLTKEGTPNYTWVNKELLDFLKALRPLDINVVLVAHEKLSEGKNGDGKLYPALGGPSLINKTLAEMDIVAHVERHAGDGKTVQWVGQIQPRDNLVCKDSTDALGDRRIADLDRWFQVANEALAPDDSDLPFAPADTKAHAEADLLAAAQEQLGAQDVAA